MNPFALFSGASLLAKAGVVLGLVALAGTAYGVWHHKIYNNGYSAAIAAIARQDQEAINAAKSARATFRSCVDGGGMWDATSGKCGGR